MCNRFSVSGQWLWYAVVQVLFFPFAILSREQTSFWTRGKTIGLILSHGVCEKCKEMEKESMFKDTFIWILYFNYSIVLSHSHIHLSFNHG